MHAMFPRQRRERKLVFFLPEKQRCLLGGVEIGIAANWSGTAKPLNKHHSPEPSQRTRGVDLNVRVVVFVRTCVKVHTSGEFHFY
jgi:hypothetical protein